MLFSTFAGYLAGGVAGAIVATFFVFLPSFVFVLGGAHYVEKVQDNATIQAFLSGVSAAVVGVIAVVSVELIPEAIVGWPTMLIAAAAFLAIVWWKRDVALVAIGGIVGGVIYAIVTYQ
jgi:chromate transporter